MFRAVLIAAICAAGAAAAEPAKYRFGAAKSASTTAPAPHGTYSNGCLAGGEMLPITGPGWQAMRLERNRNWGHPDLIRFVERLGAAAQGVGWPGLLIGDLSQPRGGPMISSHRSHQIGLDVDIWMRPGMARELSRKERSKNGIGSYSVTTGDQRAVNKRWTPEHAAVLRAAASDPAVTRIFVNAAIKKELCESTVADRGWLAKIRPWWGHNAHFHVRLRCPAGATTCVEQDPPPPGDGCDPTLAWWFSEEARNPKPQPGAPKKKSAGQLTLADMPAACTGVLAN